MRIRDIMTAHPAAVLPGDSVVSAARVMRDRDISMVPVVDAFDTMKLVGAITDHDIATRCTAQAHVDACMVAEHMTAIPVSSAHPGDDVDDAIDLMRSSGYRRLPVVDDHGVLVGMLTSTDLSNSIRTTEMQLIESTLAAATASGRRLNHFAKPS